MHNSPITLKHYKSPQKSTKSDSYIKLRPFQQKNTPTKQTNYNTCFTQHSQSPKYRAIDINIKINNYKQRKFVDQSVVNPYSHISSTPKIKNMGFSNPRNKPPYKVATIKQINFNHNFNINTKYKILSSLDWKLALDVTSLTNNQKGLTEGSLIIWQYHGGPNQHFYIRFYGRLCKIISAASGFCIEVPNSQINNGIQLQANPINDSKQQYFELIPCKNSYSDDIYEIKTFCGKVMDVENQCQNNGTRVVQWSSNKGKNQLWRITAA